MPVLKHKEKADNGKRTETHDARYYEQKMRSAVMLHKMIQILCNITLLLLIVFTVILGKAKIDRIKETEHIPVKAKNVTASVKTYESMQYSLNYKEAYKKGGKITYNLTIGSWTTERTEEEISQFGEDDVCDTEVYLLELQNESKSFHTPFGDKITIVRFSILGEKPFTEEEIQEYTKQAASYFTYEKYTMLKYDDASKYSVTIEGMEKGGLVSEIMDSKQ